LVSAEELLPKLKPASSPPTPLSSVTRTMRDPKSGSRKTWFTLGAAMGVSGFNWRPLSAQ
jgi:hypothetical protein